MIKRIWVAVLTAAIVATLLTATPAAAQTDQFVLSGTIAVENGDPGAGAIVTALPAGSSTTAGTDTADASGAFAITLPANSYDVRIELDGWETVTLQAIDLSADRSINVVLVPTPPVSSTATVSGTVTLGDGSPATGLLVSPGVPIGPDGSYALTATVGSSFRLPLVTRNAQTFITPCGNEIFGPCPDPNPALPDMVDLRSDEITVTGPTTLDVVLPVRTWTVTVVDPDGTPISSPFVSLASFSNQAVVISPTGTYVGSQNVTRSGTSTVDLPVFDGTALLSVSAIGYQQLQETVSISGDATRTVTLEPVPPDVTLSGTVTLEDGTPASGLLVGRDLPVASDGSYSRVVPAGTTLNFGLGTPGGGSGPFGCGFFASCPPSNPALPDSLEVFSDTPLTLTEDTTLDVVLPLRTLTVTVVEPDGTPIPSASASLVAGNGSSLFGAPSGTNVQFTTPAGIFNGAQRVNRSGATPLTLPVLDGAALLSVFADGYLGAQQTVTITEDQNLTITLQPQPATLVEVSGTVTLSDGTPATGLLVGPGIAVAPDGSYTRPLEIPVPAGTLYTPLLGTPAGTTGLFACGGQSYDPCPPTNPALPDYTFLSGEQVIITGSTTIDAVLEVNTLTVAVVDRTGAPVETAGASIIGGDGPMFPGASGTSVEFSTSTGTYTGGHQSSRSGSPTLQLPVFQGRARLTVSAAGFSTVTQLIDIDGDETVFVVMGVDQACVDVTDSDGDGIGDSCEGDTEPPTVTGSPSIEPNTSGWLAEAVTITWSAADPEPSAGLLEAAPSPTVADTEGTVLYTSDAVCDVLGQCATGSLELSIDLGDPVVDLQAPADGSEIEAADYVEPTCTASDAVSGLDGACVVAIDQQPGPDSSTIVTATATATDLAGNVTTATSTFTVLAPVPADSDGDGIFDDVDVEPGVVSSAFDDGAGTSGVIVSNTTGVPATVAALASGGVEVTVAGTTGTVEIDACGFTLILTPGDIIEIVCGSIQVSVLAGDGIIVRPPGDGATTVEIPVAVSVRVTEPVDDNFTIEHLSGDAPVVVTTDGQATTVQTGETATFTSNVAPTITTIQAPSEAIETGATIEVTAPFVDPGLQDTHQCLFTWGDGTTETVPAQSSSCIAQHSYTSAGIYDLTVTVTDNAGDSDTATAPVIVFSPDGFVTAAGIFTSPAGAVTNAPTTRGVASVTLTARYNRNNTPTGRLRFTLGAAGLSFRSDTIDWIVIENRRNAQIQGTGRLNGQTGHTFRLWIRDNNRDAIRIQITNPTGTTIYDNGPDLTRLTGATLIRT